MALRTSRCRVGTDSRPLASRLSDEAPWNKNPPFPEKTPAQAPFPTKLHFFALYQEIQPLQGVNRFFFNEIKGLEQVLRQGSGQNIKVSKALRHGIQSKV
jgi:hypothetical protein